MGPVATAVAMGCLTALRWLTWVAAGLLLVLIAVQFLRGDEGAQPVANALVALGLAAGGWLAGFVADKLASSASG